MKNPLRLVFSEAPREYTRNISGGDAHTGLSEAEPRAWARRAQGGTCGLGREAPEESLQTYVRLRGCSGVRHPGVTGLGSGVCWGSWAASTGCEGQVSGHQNNGAVKPGGDFPCLQSCSRAGPPRDSTASCGTSYVHLFGVSGIEILEMQRWPELQGCPGTMEQMRVCRGRREFTEVVWDEMGSCCFSLVALTYTWLVPGASVGWKVHFRVF